MKHGGRERPGAKGTRSRRLQECPSDDLHNSRQGPEHESQAQSHEDLENQAQWEKVVADESAERGPGSQSLAQFEADEKGHLEDGQAAGRMEEPTVRELVRTSLTEMTQDEHGSRPHPDRDGGGDGEVPVGVAALVQRGLP